MKKFFIVFAWGMGGAALFAAWVVVRPEMYWPHEYIVIRVPYEFSDVPANMIPMGETVNHPKPQTPKGHPGIDFGWGEGELHNVISSSDGKVSSIKEGASHPGKWDVEAESGLYILRYKEMDDASPELRVGSSVKQGDLIGHVGRFCDESSPYPHCWFNLHWELASMSFLRDRFCPVPYFDANSRQSIEALWASVSPDANQGMKRLFPDICSGDYKDAAEGGAPVNYSPSPAPSSTAPSSASSHLPVQILPSPAPPTMSSTNQPHSPTGGSVTAPVPLPSPVRGTGSLESDEPPLKLKGIGVNFEDFKFTKQQLQFDRVFMEYGFVIPASSIGKEKSNPQPTYVVPLGTSVRSIVDGVVAAIPTLWSGDVSIQVTEDGEMQTWIYETEHLINPKVKVGDKVKAGQIIGEVSDFNHGAPDGYGTVEIGILKGGQTPQHVCPFAYLDDSIREETFAKMKNLFQTWEEYVGDQTLYDDTEIPGCLTLNLIDG